VRAERSLVRRPRWRGLAGCAARKVMISQIQRVEGKPVEEGRGERELEAYLQTRGEQHLNALLQVLLPVVSARAARALRRSRELGRDTTQEVPDLVQDVIMALLDEDAKVLRAWTPSRGLSLLNFVGLVSQRQISSILRSSRTTARDAIGEDADAYDLERVGANPEFRLMSRQLVLAVIERVHNALSPQGIALFELLLISGESVEYVSDTLNMSRDAVYAWRSRLFKIVSDVSADLAKHSSKMRVRTKPKE